MCCRSCIWCSVEIAKLLFLVDGHFGMWKVYQLLVYTWGLVPSGMLSQALRDWIYQYNAPLGFSMCLFSFIPFLCCLLICSVFSYLSSYLRILFFPYSNTLYIRGPNVRWFFLFYFFLFFKFQNKFSRIGDNKFSNWSSVQITMWSMGRTAWFGWTRTVITSWHLSHVARE